MKIQTKQNRKTLNLYQTLYIIRQELTVHKIGNIKLYRYLLPTLWCWFFVFSLIRGPPFLSAL